MNVVTSEDAVPIGLLLGLPSAAPKPPPSARKRAERDRNREGATPVFRDPSPRSSASTEAGS